MSMEEPNKVQTALLGNNILIILVLLCSTIFGSDSQFAKSSEHQSITMDTLHEYLSDTILLLSSELDHKVSSGFEDQNQSQWLDGQNRDIYQTHVGINDFFVDPTFFDATNKSYIKIGSGYQYDFLGTSGLAHSFTARIKLPKTQDKLQIFIGDDLGDEILPFFNGNPGQKEGVGLKYYFPSFGRLISHASVGFSGINNPYTKTYFDYPVLVNSWILHISQNFKYSLENEFDEWSDIYIDRKISDEEVVRLLLRRSTNSNVRGMDYTAQLALMNTHKNQVGYHYYIAANGRTKDIRNEPYSDGTFPQEGVYEYAVGMIWRQQFFKEYLFYQIQPIVSFHEQYDYRSNYLLKCTFEIYFGKPH